MEITPNVEMLRKEKIRLIVGSYPAHVRKEWGEGVKAGLLAHRRKDGLLLEFYCHPDWLGQALLMQRNQALRGLEAIKKICSNR